MPAEIVVPEAVPEAEAFVAFAQELRGTKVRLHIPQRGRKRHLLEIAVQGAGDALQQERVRWMADRENKREALDELAQALGLEGPPRRIECFDVSHVQGTSVVASMVVFEEGRPAKQFYRRFRSKLSERNDDFANMRDVLRRRFARASVGAGSALRARAEPPSTEASPSEAAPRWPEPDLVILDGGKGQLAVGRQVLSDTGRLDVPIAALAKEREELFLPDRADPVILEPRSQALFLVQRIRDEAHRFAVTYHQKVRSRRAVRSILDDVPGVGPAKKRALLRKFGSVKAMRDAPPEELAAVPGVGAALAERIREAISTSGM